MVKTLALTPTSSILWSAQHGGLMNVWARLPIDVIGGPFCRMHRAMKAAMPPEPPQIRTATPNDVTHLVTVVHAAYRDPDDRGWTTEAGLLGGQRIDAAMLEEILGSPGTTVLVAETDGRIVGCGAVSLGDPPTATFGMFAVHPTHQSLGIGHQLLETAERRAAESGCVAMDLDVIDVRTELIAWYRRRGYVPTGATKPFPYGDHRFGIPRRDDLRFTTLSKRLSGP